jgi:hypothetical protein
VNIQDKRNPLIEDMEDYTEIRFGYQPYLKVWERSEKIILNVGYYDHEKMESSPVYKLPIRKDSMFQDLVLLTKQRPEFGAFWASNKG